MAYFDLCLTWCWEYDADFARLLEAACQANRLTILHVTPASMDKILAELAAGQISFGAHFDISVYDVRFEPIFRWAEQHGAVRINPQEVGAWAEDKATMHLELINAGIYTPHAIILPPYNEQTDLPLLDLTPLGEPFVIKPCYGGGGEGVIMGARSLEQVLRARCEFPDLKYLLQAQITSQEMDGREAWFRIIYCAGQFYPCWWNTRTHVYTPVTAQEETRFKLSPLREVTKRIAQVCKLDLFSTEIAHTPEGRWVAVDYVNDHIDLRLQSKTADAVPDSVVTNIAADLASLVARKRRQRQFERFIPRFLLPKS